MANLARMPGGIAKFMGSLGTYRALGAAYKEQLNQEFPEHTAQAFNMFVQSYVADERKALVVSKNLQMSRADFTKYLDLKEDASRMFSPAVWTALTGGLSLLGLPFWANATHKLPACFFDSEEAKIEAAKLRDQEVHIKHAPLCQHTHMRYMEYFISSEPQFNEAFDSIGNGFMAPKNVKQIRKMGQFISKMETSQLRYVSSDINSWLRGRELYETAAFLGKPFMFVQQEPQINRIVEYYRGCFQEDALIQKEGVASLSDYELYHICNRRLIARWEENLSRTVLEARLADWMELTALEEDAHVPLRIIAMYQAAHFRDPGFLDENLESLDTDAFPSAWNWSRDAFQRRVEFESGPLADQVRAHVLETEKAEALAREERTNYLASKA